MRNFEESSNKKGRSSFSNEYSLRGKLHPETVTSQALTASGITLIALVITIIVMLILVGVTLSMISGENGILGKAEKAADATIISSAKEQAELLVADYLTTYYEEGYANGNQEVASQKAEDYVASQVGTGKTTSSGDYFVTIGSDGTVTVYNGTSADENNKMAEGNLLEGGKIVWNGEVSTGGTSTATITNEENMGDYVDLGTDLLDRTIALSDGTTPQTDWRIFYKDGDNVWLIMSDYLPYAKNSVVGTTLSQYSTDYPYNWRSSTSRTDLITQLKDTSKWNNLISGSDLAGKSGVSVTGALEMETYVKSWNEKWDPDLYTATKSMDDGLNGYYVGTSVNPTSTSVRLSSSDGYSDTLYYPHKSSLSNCYGYWLASPSAYRANRVMYVYYDGYVTYYDAGNAYRGVRPAVCLPSSLLTKGADGIWIVAK